MGHVTEESNTVVDHSDSNVSDKPKRSRVSGIDRVFQIIDYLYEAGEAAGGYAIAKSIGAPLSTVYTITEDLVVKNILTRDHDGLLWLGPRLHNYGLAYARSVNFIRVATQEMHDLSRLVGETVQICGRDGNHMIVMAMANGKSHFQVASPVGSRVPLNWTASGRLLVGHLSETERLAVFREGARKSPTGRAITDPEILAKTSGEAFAQRLSIQIAESDYAVACIASPICDMQGNCAATISIVLPEQKAMAGDATYGDKVRESAERIERLMGWRAH